MARAKKTKPEAGSSNLEATEAVVEETVDVVEDSTETGTPVDAPATAKRGGFFPLLLGGIVAAGIGFVAARYMEPGSWPFGDDSPTAFETTTIANHDAQSAAIDGLRVQVRDLAAQSDTSEIEAMAKDAQGGVEALRGQLAQIGARVNDLTFRLTALEKRPITEGISDAAIAAFEAELKAVQDAIATQLTDIESATKVAAAKEADAAISEIEAMTRAALSQIQTALDTGSSFAPAVANLVAVGQTVPDALTNTAENGVPTLAGLQDAFALAARAALVAGRSSAKEGGGFGSFFRNQLGVRSLTPKDGDGTDAILSRAEAALKQGRLLDTVAELQSLQDSAKPAMAGWLADAAIRQNALAAVEVLGQQLISN